MRLLEARLDQDSGEWGCAPFAPRTTMGAATLGPDSPDSEEE